MEIEKVYFQLMLLIILALGFGSLCWELNELRLLLATTEECELDSEPLEQEPERSALHRDQVRDSGPERLPASAPAQPETPEPGDLAHPEAPVSLSSHTSEHAATGAPL